MSWLYSYFSSSIIRNMKPQYFFIITRRGALGLGEFPFHKWHKREKEHILKAVGVKVEYGEPLHEGEYRGTFRTVSDKEHAEMIRLYVEEEQSLEKIADLFKRSSRTPLFTFRSTMTLSRAVDSVHSAEEPGAHLKTKLLRKSLVVKILYSHEKCWFAISRANN